MTGYKSVWISTPPRTGSTWLFNVARAVLKHAGLTVLPERVPQEVGQMLELARRDAWTDTDPSRVWVLKIHEVLLRTDLPRSRIITSVRDPRDVLVSFRRFMNTSFEHALNTSESVIRYVEHYRSHQPDLLLPIDYQQIEREPAAVVQAVAAFLGRTLSAADAARIAGEFSRDRVRQLIERTEASVRRRLAENVAVARDEVVLREQAVTRAFDTATGFQTGHVSASLSGDWRKLLSADEKRCVAERYGDWLARNGFPAA